MATSGVYTTNYTFEDLADEVLDILQITGDGETLTTAQLNRLIRSANLLIKEWEGQGIHLWTYTEGTLFLVIGQAEYDLRDATVRVTNEYFETRVAVAQTAGNNTVELEDVTNIQDTDPIGLIDSTGDLFWTTVNGAPVGNVVTLTDNLANDVAVNAVVYNYRVGDLIPISRVLDVRRRESSDYEIPIQFESRKDYFNLPNKSQLGLPIQAYYSRQLPQGIFYLWTAPFDAKTLINFTYERELQVIVASTDDLDMPEYWFNAFAWCLADKVKMKFGTSPERAATLAAESEIMLNQALSFDNAVYPIEIKVQQYG